MIGDVEIVSVADFVGVGHSIFNDKDKYLQYVIKMLDAGEDPIYIHTGHFEVINHQRLMKARREKLSRYVSTT